MRSLRALLVVVLLAFGPPAAFASDGDSDRVEDEIDNCVGGANPFQFDADGDGEGDLCERPIPMSDDFVGAPGNDLVFGGFRPSTLAGGPGNDSLYGEAGDDVLDGGDGRDSIAGGPGDDRMTGGPHCDVFGIETRIEQSDVITDFAPAIDRVRFPPLFRERARDRLPTPRVNDAGEHLVVAFVVDDEPVAVVTFEGLAAGAPVVMSTRPCGDGPPPPGICPAAGAARTALFIGYDEVFCPGDGELHLNTGVYGTARWGATTGKTFGGDPR